MYLSRTACSMIEARASSCGSAAIFCSKSWSSIDTVSSIRRTLALMRSFHQPLHLGPDLGPVRVGVLAKELGPDVGPYLRKPERSRPCSPVLAVGQSGP